MNALVQPQRGRRSLIPWLFPGGLGLVVAVNMVLLWFALGTFPGLVETNSYERGRHYNEVIERAAAIAALGWHVDVELLADGVVVARYRDRDGKPIGGLDPRATLTRPVGDPVRIEVRLREGSAGEYRAEIVLPHHGLWDVNIVAGARPVPHEMTARVNVP
jgi:nitrogen fixation protein FixH